MTGSASVRISLSEQRAYLYKGGQLAGVSLISSGREGLGTVTGNYRILEKDREHRSSLFGAYMDASGEVMQRDVDTTKDPKPPGTTYLGADMPNWMRITGGTGMHAGFLPAILTHTAAFACRPSWQSTFSNQWWWERRCASNIEDRAEEVGLFPMVHSLAARLPSRHLFPLHGT